MKKLCKTLKILRMFINRDFDLRLRYESLSSICVANQSLHFNFLNTINQSSGSLFCLSDICHYLYKLGLTTSNHHRAQPSDSMSKTNGSEQYYKYNYSNNHHKFKRLSIISAFVPGLFTYAVSYEKNYEYIMKQREFNLSAQVGNISRMKDFISKGVQVNDRHPYGWCPIHTAAVNGKAKAIALLLENGADPNLPDNFTNIFQIARENLKSPMEVEVIRESEFSSLLNHTQIFRGCTALHYAVLANDQECVKILLDAGADPTALDGYHRKPEDYAKDIGMKTLLNKFAQQYQLKQKQMKVEERRKFPLEQRIKQNIIGQEGAIVSVCGAIRRKENGWYDEEHPLVFLFLGSSGIGKTELAKQIADYLKSGFIRVDMSEYQQKHEVSKFIGSPPGYIGHDDGGQLTKRLTKNPNSVVLFDEVEKAHPDILTILLQLFDEGRLTDGKGKTIECKNAIFIMTSNLASDEIAEHSIQLREEAKEINEQKYGKSEIQDVEVTESITISRRFKEKIVRPILKSHFQRDEFLGRINEIIYFVPFSRPELLSLVTIELERWKKQAQKKHNIELQWDPIILDIIADGYNIHYGARSVKHEVERRIINQLALAHECGLIDDGSFVNITAGVSNSESDKDRVTDAPIPIKIKVKSKKDGQFTDIDPQKQLKTNKIP